MWDVVKILAVKIPRALPWRCGSEVHKRLGPCLGSCVKTETVKDCERPALGAVTVGS